MTFLRKQPLAIGKPTILPPFHQQLCKCYCICFLYKRVKAHWRCSGPLVNGHKPTTEDDSAVHDWPACQAKRGCLVNLFIIQSTPAWFVLKKMGSKVWCSKEKIKIYHVCRSWTHDTLAQCIFFFRGLAQCIEVTLLLIPQIAVSALHWSLAQSKISWWWICSLVSSVMEQFSYCSSFTVLFQQ